MMPNSQTLFFPAVAGKSADEVKQLIANKYAVKDTAFKAIVAVVLNRHDTNINSSGKEEPLTATTVKKYINK